jgi:hypothetical protein
MRRGRTSGGKCLAAQSKKRSSFAFHRKPPEAMAMYASMTAWRKLGQGMEWFEGYLHYPFDWTFKGSHK